MVTRGWVLAGGFAGRRGRRPLRVARGRAAVGACLSSGPAGPPSPKGEGKSSCWRQRKPPRGVGDAAPYGSPGDGRRRKVAAGWGHPALRMGIWKRPRGLRGHPFPGRRAVGAGHARPGGLRRQASMVRSVGRGLDPSAEVGGGASLRGASGTPPPTVCPGKGGGGRPRRGGGTPPYVWGDMETLWGLREHPFPGRRAVGAGHARPGGLRGHPSMVRSVGRGLDPSAGGCPGDGRWRKVSRGVGDAAPTVYPGMGGSGSLPLIRPCGATFPRGGRQGLLLAAAQACPYPGSWSSVRSWRVRL